MLQIKALLRYFAAMGNVNLDDYTYALPDKRIARYPLEQRDQSRLLVYDRGIIRHLKFGNLAEVLPAGTILFFNDTRVIPARIFFHKPSGAQIEVFLLNPVEPSPVVALTMASRASCAWQCTIGNLKRWTDGLTLALQAGDQKLTAELVDRRNSVVKFTWSADETFAKVLEKSGITPLPPYLHRAAEPPDRHRYQTVYSKHEGAVAAPTAGLHFTEDVLRQLDQKNIPIDFLTLHVSAGTFLPVKEQNAALHTMHDEQVVVSRENVRNLLLPGKRVVAVGTTSMRTLESLYWYGVKLLRNPHDDFIISQNDPCFGYQETPSAAESFTAVAKLMDERGLNQLGGRTSIYILPGYRFRVCDGLITNFHQPGSTLLLLIAAFIGDDWKKVYREALENGYRFLSYGDSSLLLPDGLMG